MKAQKKFHWIVAITLIAIAMVSFLFIAKWATSIKNYTWIVKTLNSMQEKALGLTATATALATGAAAIPGDATTPIANKLADVAGYMVFVYAAIIIEKYLLIITGFILFKICLPIGCIFMTIGNFIHDKFKPKIFKFAKKSILLGLLLWLLVPASAWITNTINTVYTDTYTIDSELIENSKKSAEENSKEDSSDQNTNDNTDNSDKSFWQNFKGKVEDFTTKAEEKISGTVTQFENALNQLIEGVAVMIVTTCFIPIGVLFAFLWIVKSIIGLNFSMPKLKKLPKASQIKTNKYEEKE